MRPFASAGLRPLRCLQYFTNTFSAATRSSQRSLSSQIAHLKPCRTPTHSISLWSKSLPITAIRQKSTTSAPLTEEPGDRTETDADRQKRNEERRRSEEAYQIVFTCKPCGERSSHRMSKQGYHRGTVLIQCPSCSNRHVMSDHLGIFFDKRTTLEDLLNEKGQALTHGHTDGNLEFWEDGTVKSFGLDGRQLLESTAEKSS